MKTIQNILSVTLKSALFLSIVILTSCSKDDAPNPIEATTNFDALPTELITTFTGLLDYEGADGTDLLDNGGGTATISGTSSNYTITFNNNVPNISNIKFNLINGQYFHIVGGTTIDPDETVIVRTFPQLAIGVERNGNAWIFNGE